MRKVILIISFILYLFAAVITYKAINILSPGTVSTLETFPTDEPSIKSIPQGPGDREFEDKVSEEKEGMSIPSSEEQTNDKAVVDELKSTIVNLEERLAKVEEKKALDNTVIQNEQTETVIATIEGTLLSSGQNIANDELRTVVKDIVKMLMAFPEHQIKVEGHTDNLPVASAYSSRYKDNYELSFLRAKAVALLLEEYGVSKERISIVGYGDTRPIATNTTKEGRAQNRRVEIRVISPSR